MGSKITEAKIAQVTCTKQVLGRHSLVSSKSFFQDKIHI